MNNFNRICPSGNIAATLHPNPPTLAPCWKCNNTRRVKATRDEVAEKVAVWGDVYGCRWALDLVKEWEEDGKIDCGEC
jgi:hypothetical protein